MTSPLTVARVAALVAILGFFLPWAEVSCSGQMLSHESGIELITGGAGAGATTPAHHNVWVAASLALIVLGLVGGLIARGRRGATILMAVAPAAAIASLIGVSQEVPSADAQGDLLRAKLEYGYFLTLGGLIVVIAASAFALAGERSSVRESE